MVLGTQSMEFRRSTIWCFGVMGRPHPHGWASDVQRLGWLSRAQRTPRTDLLGGSMEQALHRRLGERWKSVGPSCCSKHLGFLGFFLNISFSA